MRQNVSTGSTVGAKPGEIKPKWLRKFETFVNTIPYQLLNHDYTLQALILMILIQEVVNTSVEIIG